MDFIEATEIVKKVLYTLGSSIDSEQYDGLIVKKLTQSNILDRSREKTNQTHIAITGAQMDIFPYIRAEGFFETDYDSRDKDLKKYFIVQTPIFLHKENISCFASEDKLMIDDEVIRVYISSFRNRRKDSSEQVQLCLIEHDTELFTKFRELIPVNSYIVMLKRKNKFEYDFYAIPLEDAEKTENSLKVLNNQFFKLETETELKIDDVVVNKCFEKEIPAKLTGENNSDASMSEKIRYKTNLSTSYFHNRILFGAPGTGKSFTLNEDRAKLLADGGEYARVTFHPDYSYAHFVGTYKPVPKGEEISYEYVAGPFIRTLVKALQSGRTENPKPYLLIIEEINRANAAAVFGDVFQLLDRKDGASEYAIQTSRELREYLAKPENLGGDAEDYEEIRIPDNMFIWATMNSADQGVYPMDTAFKRRWDFTYIGIDDGENEAVIKNNEKVVIETAEKGSQYINWNNLRKAINKKLDEDCQVNEDKLMGPFFISPTALTDEKFKDAFKNKVLMYLCEDVLRHRGWDKLFEKIDGMTHLSYAKVCNAFDKKGIDIFVSGVLNAEGVIVSKENDKAGAAE